MKNILQRFNCF